MRPRLPLPSSLALADTSPASRAVPLSTLITAAKPPRADAAPNPKNPTLHHGVKRYMVVHGGLFSREDVMLDEIRKIPRLSQKQPGHEGLMVRRSIRGACSL